MNHEVVAIERMKMKTRTMKLCTGLASSDSLTNLPKALTFDCCVSMEDDCAIVIMIGLQLGVRDV